jgi:hypothetical protein
MLSINTDEKLITMRMCLMGLLSAGEHNNCSQIELVEWAGCLAEGLLREYHKTLNITELAAKDNQQLKTEISVLATELYEVGQLTWDVKTSVNRIADRLRELSKTL